MKVLDFDSLMRILIEEGIDKEEKEKGRKWEGGNGEEKRFGWVSWRRWFFHNEILFLSNTNILSKLAFMYSFKIILDHL